MSNSYFDVKKSLYTKPVEEPGETPEGVPPFVRTAETGDKVFFVKDGLYHWIIGPEVLQALGGNFGMVKQIERGVFKLLRMGEKITMDTVDQYKIEEVKVEVEDKIEFEKLDESRKEFQTYEEAPNAPGKEPVKGFTSIIMPVYWVNYPAFHYTGNAIGSIREHTNKEDTPYEIILVVNGNKSAVERFEDARLTYADKVIVNDENLGYAKAVNQGIRVAKGEYIAVVNSDIQVFDEWLEYMRAALQILDLVMATPMYGKPFARAIEAKELYLANVAKVNNLEEAFSDFVDFSCVLTRKDMFDKIGLFNEEFFMYCEDLDLMRRMKEAGLKYASTKLVNVSHIIGATSSGVNETPEIMNQSKEKLKEIWGY